MTSLENLAQVLADRLRSEDGRSALKKASDETIRRTDDFHRAEAQARLTFLQKLQSGFSLRSVDSAMHRMRHPYPK